MKKLMVFLSVLSTCCFLSSCASAPQQAQAQQTSSTSSGLKTAGDTMSQARNAMTQASLLENEIRYLPGLWH